MDIEKIAVLGAGHGGHAVAADLSLAGYKINMFSRSRETLEPIIKAGGIEIIGDAREGFAKLYRVTNNIKEAIEDVNLIVVVVPTTAHKFMAEACAPHLKDGQVIFLDPGHTGGTLEFAKTLENLGVKKKIKIGESMTITHGSRTSGPAKVKVVRRSINLLFSALPATDTLEVIDYVKEVFPTLTPAENVLETGLSNINAVEHPAGMLMNAGWVEATNGNFFFYFEGITPSVARVLEAVDSERVNIMKALGLKAAPFVDMFFKGGWSSLDKGSVYESMQMSVPNRFIKSPQSMRHRYVDEDVGYGLVPMASIGQIVSIPTPIIGTLITLASVVNQTDYWKEGRTVEKMGIAGLNSAEKLKNFVTYGK